MQVVFTGGELQISLVWLLLVLLIVSAIVQALCMGRSYRVSHTAVGVLAENLRQRQITKLLRLPLSWFTSHSSGRVKKFIQDDVSVFTRWLHMLCRMEHLGSSFRS